MSKLVIVESPAKAKTISQFLGKGYQVLASYGHVRDLPESAAQIPEEYKKYKWSKLGVNVDEGFQPLYIVPPGKKKYLDALSKALKESTELLLATDEDREGESISWHILEVLKPKKNVKISRIVFHEITSDALNNALAHPRSLDKNLVKAQEARRVLDRLYGYTLSPLLWKKVAPRLSAGRVQSVAVRTTVVRERERLTFVPASYHDLEALLIKDKTQFKAKLMFLNGVRLATGKSFDPDTGKLKDEKVCLLSKEQAENLQKLAKNADPWVVTSVETKPNKQFPSPPFMTSTLQQDAIRKLRMSARQTMQVAQSLYEGVELEGQRVGLITYMRTDSLTLSEKALTESRKVIEDLYGKEYLPSKATQYKTKSKNAQEAHEAIRPTYLSYAPKDIKKYLTPEQYALYELIWRRTLASQMKPAEILRTIVKVQVNVEKDDLEFQASGKQILFPGYLKVYIEGSDEIESDDKEAVLPALKESDQVELLDLQALSHMTRPPARFTEASLIKYLEENGIGRPSTYAPILSTIIDRGYILKKGPELIPTFTACAVTQLLEDNFKELVNMGFTARMESELDEIAEGQRDQEAYLSDFYHGQPNQLGIQRQVAEKEKTVPYPHILIGKDDSERDVFVRIGSQGPFIQRGEGGKGNTSPIPEDVYPADLKLIKALELLDSAPLLSESINLGSYLDKQISLKQGPYGQYLELELSEEEQQAKKKPKRASLPKELTSDEVTPEIAIKFMELPKDLGKDSNGNIISLVFGPYGPYLQIGSSRKSLSCPWQEAIDFTLEKALEFLSKPAEAGGKSFQSTVIKSFGSLQGIEGEVRLLKGRYGPYLTNGIVNVKIPSKIKEEALNAPEIIQLFKDHASKELIEKTTKKRKVSPKTKKR